MHTSTKITKYRPFPQIDLPNRQWPSRTIDRAPVWCSVDLRDGNQALPVPMNIAEKLEYFEALVKIGFKEIEVGFPSASQTEFDFLRKLIDDHLIPDDVTVQVLVQSREDLIRRSFEALKGSKNAIVHLYNSTSPAQREIVFRLEKQGVIDLAVSGTKLIKQLAAENPETKWRFQYSPESFCMTELDFALQICEAVCEVWQPTEQDKIILNLPATVEVATPNVHADQIEWFCTHTRWRKEAIISLHTHNDRGTGIAATELALLAGADRVEGTLFGNGERTGNVDIVTVALNMYTQGVYTRLDFTDINGVRDIYERCTKLEVPIRSPYAGELVFTAFSGSHQDAINKGMKAQSQEHGALWNVPYLPIDPQDLGRNYRAIIRINSQSGKGGVAYVMEQEHGFVLPKAMHKELGKLINDLADQRGEELSPAAIFEAFQDEYVRREGPLTLVDFQTHPPVAKTGARITCEADITWQGQAQKITGHGNGPIDAFVHALRTLPIPKFEVLSYAEHSLGAGAEASAVAYVQIKTVTPQDREITRFGAGIDSSIDLASFKAIVNAVNRSTT